MELNSKIAGIIKKVIVFLWKLFRYEFNKNYR